MPGVQITPWGGIAYEERGVSHHLDLTSYDVDVGGGDGAVGSVHVSVEGGIQCNFLIDSYSSLIALSSAYFLAEYLSSTW